MGAGNPLGLDHARAFAAWSVSEGGTHATVYWPGFGPIITLRFFIADEADAVHVLVICAAPVDQLPASDVSLHMDDESFERAELWLPTPIGERPLVDATAGLPRPRVESDRHYVDLMRTEREERRDRRVQPGDTRRWTYET
ncbi:MAG: hypothetical protein AAGC46_01640, partial [Solirubrobacteraceae bacterium]|nr:hypothetical protein [Patulibacter sp.]